MASIFDTATSVIHDEWREFMRKNGLLELARKALDDAIRASGGETAFARNVSPSVINIFAFAQYPLSSARVIILGQDPYPNRTDACGLSFSVADESRRIPPSLRMIFTTLIGQGLMRESSANHGNLARWCEQGVILANMALTTIIGKSREHFNLWRNFTSALMRALSNDRPGMIFILLGKDAQRINGEIKQGNGCVRLCWGHPSPLNPMNRDATSSQHFSKCPCFARANAILVSTEREPIDWDPVARPKIVATTTDGAATSAAAAATAVTLSAESNHSYELVDMDNDPSLVCPFEDMIVAFVDGATSHNGHDDAIASYAVVICHKYVNYSISGLVAIGKHTNQRAELTALCKLLEYANSPEFAQESPTTMKLIIVYDSAYAWGAITTWYDNWRKEGMKVMATKMNVDLIENGANAFKQVRQVREVEGIHVKSHQREMPPDYIQSFYWYGNNIVDGIARKLVEDAKMSRASTSK